jgi:hypothetical protein
MPDEIAGSPQAAGAGRPKWPVSRIVLLALLAVAIGLLAMDWTRGRMPRDRAYNLLADEMPAEEDNLPKGTAAPPAKAIGKNFEIWSVEKVHDLLQRAPDKTEEQPAPNHIDTILTETYRFPGAFKSYLLVVVYNKLAHHAVNGPATMLSNVSRTD